MAHGERRRPIVLARLRATCITLLLSSVWLSAADGETRPANARLLVICVDGVGYDLVQEMHRNGDFKHLLPPAPVINAFPSLTNPALVEILQSRGAPPARGYEDLFFDPARNRMAGGLLYRLSNKKFIETTYRSVFDYHPHPASMTLEYALPVLGPWMNGAINLAGLKSTLKKSDKQIVLAYFDSSDLAVHLYGKWIIRGQLRAIDRLAGELASAENPVQVVVFSDHGNKMEKLRRANLKKALKQGGFHVRHKVTDERSVVLPRFGLVSAAVLYAKPESQERLATTLTQAKGVDLVAYRDVGAVHVLSAGGRAQIERRVTEQGTNYRYRPMEGDPLLLADAAGELLGSNQMETSGFASAEAWLRATETHVYPDPLRRLWASFDGLVEQPATVIVSLQKGYYTGSPLLDLFAWMRATHGSLRRAQSLGMVTSTDSALFLPHRGPFTGANLFGRIEGLAQED